MRNLKILLATVTFFFLATIPSYAATDLQIQIDNVLNQWNSNPRWEYGGAYQCNAFTRFTFHSLYGHRDGTQCSGCQVQHFYGKNSTELKSDFRNLVNVGDVVRLTSKNDSSKTHTFLVYEVGSGSATIIESNIKDGQNNLAYKGTYSYSQILKRILGGDSAYTGYVLRSRNQPYANANVITNKIVNTNKSYSINKVGVRVDAKVLSEYTPIVRTGLQLSVDGGNSWVNAAADENLYIVDKYVKVWYILPRDSNVPVNKGQSYLYRVFAVDSYGNIYQGPVDTFILKK